LLATTACISHSPDHHPFRRVAPSGRVRLTHKELNPGRTAVAPENGRIVMGARIGKALHAAGDRGASAVEYGLMVAGIAALIVGVVFSLGNVMSNTFERTTDCIAAGQNAAPTFPNCPRR
jgi:pilus assembly protein Flp/PilA